MRHEQMNKEMNSQYYLPTAHHNWRNSVKRKVRFFTLYEHCPESKDTKVFKKCTIFLIYKSDIVNELPVDNFST
jgi:hypothetical protein